MSKNDILSNTKTIVDDLGSVFFHKGGVYRAIFSEKYAKIYTELLNSDVAEELFQAGLVRTEIAYDLEIDEVPLILKHERIPFILHPSEYTNQMFWEVAKMKAGLIKKLGENGFVLKDGNAFNVCFTGNRPVFIDFTSIIKQDYIPANWINIFIKFFGVPIWLASKNRYKSFSIEYRREHHNGFGLKLFSNKYHRGLRFRGLKRLKKYENNPSKFAIELDKWIDSHKPAKTKKEYWSKYKQGHGTNFKRPETIKQKFVFSILEKNSPRKVLDLAANKGHFAAMAANMGAKVMAFDYEEYCIDQCLEFAREEKLNITVGVMNFYLPTPSHGWGLQEDNSYVRFKSDIVLALGLIHHICISQGVPVRLFCNICKRYATNGVIIEFVDSTDKHVASWKKKTPPNYSIDGIYSFMKDKFPLLEKSNQMTDNGINRTFLYFSKKSGEGQV